MALPLGLNTYCLRALRWHDRALLACVRKLVPPVAMYIKSITGRPRRCCCTWSRRTGRGTWRGSSPWRSGGLPYDWPMVIENIPGRTPPEAFVAAIQHQQREHVEQSVAYGKKGLDLGVRWR